MSTNMDDLTQPDVNRYVDNYTSTNTHSKTKAIEELYMQPLQRIAALESAIQVAREALETIRIGSGPQGELAVEALARIEEVSRG